MIPAVRPITALYLSPCHVLRKQVDFSPWPHWCLGARAPPWWAFTRIEAQHASDNRDSRSLPADWRMRGSTGITGIDL